VKSAQLKAASVLLAGIAAAIGLQAQGPSLSLPSGTLYPAGPDYATDILQDQWDFSNVEDISPDPDQLWGFSLPSRTTVTTIGTGAAMISGGWLRGLASGDTAITLLHRADANTINPGRSGQRFPIDSSRFSKLAVKMRVVGGPAVDQMQVYWYHVSGGETADWMTRGGGAALQPQVTPNTNRIYAVELNQAPNIGYGHPWNESTIKNLRLDPVTGAGQEVYLDWVRLTAPNGAGAAMMPVSLSGCSQFQQFSVRDAEGAAITISDSTGNNAARSFNYGVLPPGTYWLSATCSNVSTAEVQFEINGPPRVTVTDPDEAGDPATDFATVVRNDPWDFDQPTDLARPLNLSNLSVTDGACAAGAPDAPCGLIPTARPGATGSMLRVSSWGQIGDPAFGLVDGVRVPLNTRRHRLLTFSLNNRRPYVLNQQIGAVARLMWGSAATPDGLSMTVSQDMRVWPGFDRYTIDLASLRTDNGGIETECVPNCLTTPWLTRAIRHFRLDPHEYGDTPTAIDLDDVLLTSPDTARLGQPFTVRYTIEDAEPAGVTYTASIYRSSWPERGARTLLDTIPNLAPGQQTYAFDPLAKGMPVGRYTIEVAVDEIRGGSFFQRSVAFASGELVVEAPNPSVATVTVASPQPDQVVGVPFTIQGCAFDDSSATGGINVDDLAINMREIGGSGRYVPLGFHPVIPNLGVLQFGPLGTVVPCPGASGAYANSGFRVVDVGGDSGNWMNGSWVIEIHARSSLSGDMSLVQQIPVRVGPVPPQGPTNFQAASAGNTVTVSWDAAPGSVSYYQVHGSTDPNFSALAFSVSVPAAGTYSGQLVSGHYYLRVYARLTNGQWTDATPTRTVDVALPTPPGQPMLSLTQAAANPITLTWAAGSGGAPSSYTLHAGTAPGASNLAVAPMGMATAISAAAPLNAQIYVRVVAANAAGQATSNEVSFRLAPPSPPTLQPPTIINRVVTLSWTPPAGGSAINGYTILARYANSPAVIASLPVTGSSISVPAPPGAYVVTMVSHSASGTSAESNAISVVVP